jgi:glycosyltransferase involved in cell wall biosynthesis
MKRISVIVPMFNEARHIVRTLNSVSHAAAVAGLECELIVVDNGSRDQGPQLAREQGARVLHYPGLSIGALRNRGAESATGDWLAFIDADIEVPSNWLSLWANTKASGRADVFALDCDAPRVAPWFARAWQRRSLSGNQQERLLQWLPTPNLCLERVWFARIGGFDESLRTGEDKDFGLRLNRAGARQLSLPTPVVQHWGFEGSWREWSAKEFWRQSSHLQLLRKNGSNLRLLRFPLLCLATGLLSVLALLCLLLGQWSGAGWALLLGSIAPLGLAMRQSYRHRDPLFLLQLWLLHWLRLHLGAAALVQGLFNRTAVRPDRG